MVDWAEVMDRAEVAEGMAGEWEEREASAEEVARTPAQHGFRIDRRQIRRRWEPGQELQRRL